jgi:hypothetical protein
MRLGRPGEAWPKLRIARCARRLQAVRMPDPLIERTEVVALLFTVNDIAVTLANIEKLLGEEEDDGEEEADQG